LGLVGARFTPVIKVVKWLQAKHLEIQEIKMSTLKISKVDSLPEISRAGRKSEELNMIIDALKQSANTDAVFSLTGIKAGNAYNSMQQRIRAQAKKLGFKIVIRFDSVNEVLFFQATAQNSATPGVKASEIAGVKTKAKTR
jgi:hypothetical protein